MIKHKMQNITLPPLQSSKNNLDNYMYTFLSLLVSIIRIQKTNNSALICIKN